jgi:hypothetical protein
MLVFIDETGCPGFKLAKGSDPVFAIAMVVFDGKADAMEVEACIRGLHQSLDHKPEFKFSKCRDEVRSGFFSDCEPIAFLSSRVGR